MPPVPATAEEVPPIELDGISKLKVEVLSPTPEPIVRVVATEDRLGPPLTLAAPVMVSRFKLMGFWPPSLAPAPLTTAFKMHEVVKPDNAEEGKVRPLPPLIDKAGERHTRGEQHCLKVRCLRLSWLRRQSFEKVQSWLRC